MLLDAVAADTMYSEIDQEINLEQGDGQAGGLLKSHLEEIDGVA